MKLAFLTDCGGGPFRKVRAWGGDGNCVEGLGLALGADLYQGNVIEGGDLRPDYDIYCVNGNSTLWHIPTWLARHKRTAVLLWEGSVDDYYKRDAQSALRLRECLNACAGVLCHGPGHADVMSRIHSNVGWLGCPIPKHTPVDLNRNGRWLNAPMAFHRGIPGALIMQELGIPFVQYALEQERPTYEVWLPHADVEYRKPLAHDQFRQGLKDFCAVLNWDPIQTAGRHVLDCSAMGLPCITTRTAGAAPFVPEQWQVDPPPMGGEQLKERINSGVHEHLALPYFHELTRDRIRQRWEDFINAL